MTDYRLTDGERSALLLAAMAVTVATTTTHSPDLINAIAKISGVDTVLTVSRAYPPSVMEGRQP